MTSIAPATPSRTLRERMIEDMNLHRLSRATQRNYLREVSRFATWLGRPPDTATDEDLRRYQIEQSETGFGVPAMNTAVKPATNSSADPATRSRARRPGPSVPSSTPTTAARYDR